MNKSIRVGKWGRSVSLAGLAVAVLTAGACRSSSNSLGAAVERSARLNDTSAYDSTEATVRVENNKFPDMVVYVLTDGGLRQRIGTAVGNTTTILKIPDFILNSSSDMRFILRPIGGGRERQSDRIWVSRGDEVVLTLL